MDLANQIVTISQDEKPLKVYDFFPDTVGLWADDAPDSNVKEQTCIANYGTPEH